MRQDWGEFLTRDLSNLLVISLFLSPSLFCSFKPVTLRASRKVSVKYLPRMVSFKRRVRSVGYTSKKQNLISCLRAVWRRWRRRYGRFARIWVGCEASIRVRMLASLIQFNKRDEDWRRELNSTHVRFYSIRSKRPLHTVNQINVDCQDNRQWHAASDTLTYPMFT